MAQYTKKAIMQTFQDMLEKTPFDKITVSAIVANCSISANTFYYHFQDIYDLLDHWLAWKKEQYLRWLTPETRWQDFAKAVLSDVREHAALVYHLFRSLSRERLERSVFESTDDSFYHLVCAMTAGVEIPEEELRNVAEYNTYAFLGFLLKFLWNGMEGDLDAGVERSGGIFEQNIQCLKERFEK